MAKLNEFLQSIAKKAGVNIEDDAIRAFFSNPAFADIDVPDTVQKPVDSTLISLTDAQNNHPVIKSYYTRQALDSLDKTIDALIDEFQLSPEDVNEIKVERSSYKKPEVLIRKMQALEQKKANADKPDKAAIQKQIDDLHANLRAEQDKTKKLESEYALKEKQMKIGYKINSFRSGYKTINDHLEPEVRAAIEETLLNKRLQDNNAKYDLDENGNVVLLKSDGTNFYGDSNTQVNAKQFYEQTLSANKLLVTTSNQQQQNNSGGANGQQSQNGQNGNAPANGSGKAAGANSTFRELMKQSVADASQTSPAFAAGN